MLCSSSLGDKHVLLLLDNFEQVVDAASDVGRLLREAPHLKMLVTTPHSCCASTASASFPCRRSGCRPADRRGAR